MESSLPASPVSTDDARDLDLRIEHPAEGRRRSPLKETAAVVVWAVIVIGLVAYVAFGSITARMWKLDQLQNAWVEDHSPRRISHIWAYQFDHLPQFTNPTMMQVLVGGSIAVVVVGTAICLWWMLAEVRDSGRQPE